ncbi:MAG: hypothetical protein MI757_14740 [Pirellulales bacterium]|nr:hypothetical protein [Pirellulales bacterium]
MNERIRLVVWGMGLCATLGALSGNATGADQPIANVPAGWVNITAGLIQDIPEYEDGKTWWNKRVGKVHVDNVTGDVYVSLCEHWGTYRSTNFGDTWQLVDNRIALGRHVGDLGMFSNPATGNFVLFKVAGSKHGDGSAIVLERGTKLLPIKNIGDGWNAGMADWSQNPPRTLLARQHHSKPKAVWLSTDAGQTWEKVAEGFRYAAMIDAKTIFLGSTYYLLDGKKLRYDQYRQLDEPTRAKAKKFTDIMLTRDRGKSMTRVAEFEPSTSMPARFGDDLFWLSSEGVMVTRDRGQTWALMGKSIQMPMLGPYFGKNKDTMVVVNKEGWFKTSDAGAHWTKLAEFWYPDEKGSRQHNGNLRASWDPTRNILYIGLLGKDVYRYRVSN